MCENFWDTRSGRTRNFKKGRLVSILDEIIKQSKVEFEEDEDEYSESEI